MSKYNLIISNLLFGFYLAVVKFKTTTFLVVFIVFIIVNLGYYENVD